MKTGLSEVTGGSCGEEGNQSWEPAGGRGAGRGGSEGPAGELAPLPGPQEQGGCRHLDPGQQSAGRGPHVVWAGPRIPARLSVCPSANPNPP